WSIAGARLPAKLPPLTLSVYVIGVTNDRLPGLTVRTWDWRHPQRTNIIDRHPHELEWIVECSTPYIFRKSMCRCQEARKCRQIKLESDRCTRDFTAPSPNSGCW